MTLRLITRPVRRTPRDDYGDPDLAPAELDDEAELRDTFGDSALWLRGHVPAALAAAGVTHTVVNELPWDKFAEKLAGAAAPLAQTAERAASSAVSDLGITSSRVPGGGAGDSSFPLARRAASERAAELVQQVTDEQRQRVADVIQRALAEGWDVPRTARELRSGIGLTDAWASAVSNMYTGNLASGMDEARAGKLADQYYERLLSTRATTIARTELLDASNQGRLAGWRQAASAGVFDSATATKRWIVGDSPCPECDGLDGEVTDWDGTFSSGDDMPPAHPRCRCTAVIENVEQPGEPPAETLGPSEDDVEGEPVAAMRKYLDDQPRDEHGRFGSGGGEVTSPLSKSGVSRVVSADEAVKFSHGSAFDRDLFHGTAAKNEIVQNGFDFKKLGENTNNGGMLGAGAYVTEDQRMAGDYSRGRYGSLERDNPLVIRTNVTNPVEMSSPTFQGAYELTSPFMMGNLERGMEPPERFSTLLKGVGGVDKLLESTRDAKWPQQEMMRMVLKGQGYDSAVLRGSEGKVLELAVFDPESMVVVKP